jgi:hypothetical protein
VADYWLLEGWDHHVTHRGGRRRLWTSRCKDMDCYVGFTFSVGLATRYESREHAWRAVLQRSRTDGAYDELRPVRYRKAVEREDRPWQRFLAETAAADG